MGGSLTSFSRFCRASARCEAVRTGIKWGIEFDLRIARWRGDKRSQPPGPQHRAVGTGTRGAETVLNGGSINIFELADTALSVLFDGFKIVAQIIMDEGGPGQQFELNNSVLEISEANQPNVIYFGYSPNYLFTFTGNLVDMTGYTEFFNLFGGGTINISANTFRGHEGSYISGDDNDAPLFINLSGSQGEIKGNSFDGADIGVLIANDTGPLLVDGNSFSNMHRDGAETSGGNAAGIVFFVPGPYQDTITIINNQFSDADAGIRTSNVPGTSLEGSDIDIAGNSFTGVNNPYLDGIGGSFTATDSTIDGEHVGFFGTSGDDRVESTVDDDSYVGGTGIDTVVYDEVLTASDIVANGSSYTVSSDAEGTDTLTGFEIVEDSAGTSFLLVGSGGFATIQAAVDASGSIAGPVTIIVADGNYNESVIIDRSDLTLLSQNGRGATTITGVQGAALGTIEIDPNVNNVRIGDAGQGFTIIGTNGNGPVENAAIYLQGAHNALTIEGNDIRANGDLGLLSEAGGPVTNSIIEGNIFSGQTFVGSQPGGEGFGSQFAVGNNVPRQLAVINAGDNVTFKGNQITGTAGGVSSDTGNPQGNTLVTIDSANSEVSDNVFTGFTDRFGTALRVRGPGTDVINNLLDDSGPGQSRGILVDNQGVPGTYSGNKFTGGGDVDLVSSMTPGNDIIGLGGGNDIAVGNGGNDSIDGGGGTDTAAYAGPRSGYSFVAATDASGRVTGFTSVTDTDASNGNEGTDTLTSIEKLSFGGATLDATQKVQLFNASGQLVGTFDTIQSAENAASNGFTIRLAAGEYDEDVAIDVGVRILGAQAGTSATGRDPALAAGASNILGNIVVSSQSNVAIDGVRIVNDAIGGAPSLEILASSANVTLTNSVIFSTVRGASGGDLAISVRPSAAGSVTVTNNVISGTSANMFGTANFQSGLFFDGGGRSLTFTGNVIDKIRTGLNLEMNGDSLANVSDNVFRNAGTALSIGVDTNGLTVSNNDLQNVGTDFNLRNLTTGATFDAGAAIDALTTTGTANDLVLVYGGSGADTLTGSEFADLLDGNNVSLTATDADVLNGLAGNDQILGRGGDDKITGGSGNDTLDGGAGSDTAFFSGPRSGYTIMRSVSGGVETLTVTDTNPANGDDGTDTLINFEFLNFGGAAVPVLQGGPDAINDANLVTEDTAETATGNVLANDTDPNGDPLVVTTFGSQGGSSAAPGATIQGQYGTLKLNADGSYTYTANSDLLDALTADQKDLFTYSISDGQGGADTAALTIDVKVRNDSTTTTGTSGSDTLNGGSGEDNISGGTGNDKINGNDGADDLFGGSGNDAISGGNGRDDLSGDSGTDTIDGGAGMDNINGGSGNDRMTGGSEADRFIFGVGNGNDTITDFVVGTDKLVLEGITIRSITNRDVDGNGTQDTVVTFGSGGGSVTLLDVGRGATEAQLVEQSPPPPSASSSFAAGSFVHHDMAML